MQSNTMLCLLVLFAGSALGAPADVLPADKPMSAVDVNPLADGAAVNAKADAALKAAEDSLRKVKDSLRDAVSAIVDPAATAAGQERSPDIPSVTIPEISIKPVEVTANKKYAEIIGQFVADLIQIPIVLLHAFGEAIAGLTGSKLPQLIYPGSSSSAVATPPPYKAE